nr:MAG TPA: tail collar fiber protein [Caudoviricetes sp.]
MTTAEYITSIVSKTVPCYNNPEEALSLPYAVFYVEEKPQYDKDGVCGYIDTVDLYIAAATFTELQKLKTAVVGNLGNTVKIQSIKDTSDDAAQWYSEISIERRYRTEVIQEEDSEKEDIYSYGVIIDLSSTSPTLTRTGNPLLHKSLPVQSQMRGCLLDDDGNVVKYLDANDWTNETQDGSQGQVMIELPEFFYKFYTHADGSYEVRISARPLTGYHVRSKMYIGAYEASLQRSTMKLCSVVNTTTDYRGGGNQSAWDGTYRSQLGMPVTLISLTNFREAARRRKANSTEWNAYLYEAHKWLFWFFAIEYATLNTQADYNAEPTSEGYRQGGLGPGVTSWTGEAWNTYNNYYPIIPCGVTDKLGNGTGVVTYTIKNEEGVGFKSFSVPRYRGIENPFGHIWKFVDGINIRISPTEENGGDGLSKIYVCKDPDKFSSTSYEGYTYIGNEARENGWVKTIVGGEHGDIIPTEIGGGSTRRYCDYHYTNIPTTETLRAVLFSGAAVDGSGAGLVFANSDYAPSAASASVGSRLCFLPRNSA